MRQAGFRLRTQDFRLKTLDFGLPGVPALDGEDLLDDFFDVQVALPAERARWRRICSRRRSRPGWRRRACGGRWARRRGRVGGDEHAFDERMVAEAPEELLGGVARALLANQFQRGQGIVLAQFVAQGFGQVGHRLPMRDAMLVEPFEQLGEPVGRLAPGLEPGLQLFRGLRSYIRQHFTSAGNTARCIRAPCGSW